MKTSRRDLIDVAMGKAKADVAIRGGRLVNVLSREIYAADVALRGDRIAYVGDVKHTLGPKTKIIEAAGKYLVPGLIDGHIHMYHSYMNATQFARAALLHGTTATADAFYGPGIVGDKGNQVHSRGVQEDPSQSHILAPHSVIPAEPGIGLITYARFSFVERAGRNSRLA